MPLAKVLYPLDPVAPCNGTVTYHTSTFGAEGGAGGGGSQLYAPRYQLSYANSCCVPTSKHPLLLNVMLPILPNCGTICNSKLRSTARNRTSDSTNERVHIRNHCSTPFQNCLLPLPP